jgi:hypothetical protein
VEKGQGNAENNLWSLQEKEVPNAVGDILWKVVAKEADQPLESEKAWVEPRFLEVQTEIGEGLLKQLIEDLLIYKGTNHVRIIVKGKN